jgi:hypothetical protein
MCTSQGRRSWFLTPCGIVVWRARGVVEGARGALFISRHSRTRSRRAPRRTPQARAAQHCARTRCAHAPYVRTRDGHAARASERDRDTRGADPTAGARRIHKSPRSTRTSYRLYVRACFEQTVAWTLDAQAGVAAGPRRAGHVCIYRIGECQGFHFSLTLHICALDADSS